MTSNKQLHANRANATKSTGPRSQGGKLRSRLNSRKHGLTAKMLIIVGEHADDFDQLLVGLVEEYQPQSLLECELVERLAGILWRLRRVPSFEAAILDARHDRIWTQNNYRSAPEPEGQNDDQERREEESDWESSVELGRALIDDARYSDALGKLARHETTLMNAFAKTLQMLLLLQDKRSNTESKPVVLEAVALPPAA
jgi:hypothetical protein